jgi:excisionase family DNA binding protein
MLPVLPDVKVDNGRVEWLGLASAAHADNLGRNVDMPARRSYAGDPLLTVSEVAATMRVSNMTVYRLIKSGQLAALRVGKNYRIRESDMNAYLNEGSVTA